MGLYVDLVILADNYEGATDSVKPLSQLPAMRCKTQFGIASVWLTGFTMYVASFIIVQVGVSPDLPIITKSEEL